MSQNKNLPLKMGLICGASLGVVVVSIGIIRYKTGMILRGDQSLSYVYWMIFAITVFLAVLRFKRLDSSSFSFNRTVKIGLFAGLLSGLLYTVYIVILNNYIDPELTAKIAQFSEQALLSDNPGLSKEEIDNSLISVKMNPALRGLIYTLVCMTSGIVYSFIGTIVAKRLKH
ncbi:DUF4199 domain-containing protein [Flavobacterium pedocola]